MPKDTYVKWTDEGTLADRIKTIQELVAKKIPQKEIAKVLGISERVIIKLKNEHPQIKNAFIFGNQELKDTLVNAVYERAVGASTEDVTTTIEETPRGQRKRITKTKKSYPPDFHSARYLLITTFGRNYNAKKEEIDIMRKRQESKDEEWS